ncbi:IS110 family transposase [Hymenobacter sp.]|jgi:transposase|uniref:IS110 family transposase n=1 Tax=Hymenobacter sp. TaxID=1898978 RepID=UPI002ED7D304
MYTYFLGIDVGKETLDVALLSADHQLVEQHQLPNELPAIRRWVKDLSRRVPGFSLAHCLVCLEHTGLYNRPLLAALLALAVPVWVERAAHLKACMGLVRGKTDKADAERIARYAARYRDQAKLWQPARPVLAELDRLLARRSRLVKVIRMLQTPLSGSHGFFTAMEQRAEERGCANSLAALRADVQAVERTIKALLRDDPALAHLYERLTSVPGIGLVTAAEVLVTTNEFIASTDAKQYACYAGIVPFEHSSGQRRGRPRVSHQANKRVKMLLHLAALAAVRHCPALKAYYERKVAEGKNKMLVRNNVRNKLVHLIFACVQHDRNYDKNYAPALV